MLCNSGFDVAAAFMGVAKCSISMWRLRVRYREDIG